MQGNDYVCSCLPRFTGRECSTVVVSPCDSATCQNGGTCIDDPCQNDDTCVEENNDYSQLTLMNVPQIHVRMEEHA